MSLKTSDLVDAFAGFKSELQSEIRADLFAQFESFKSELDEKLAGIRSDLDSMGTRMLDAEATVQCLEDRSSHHKDAIQALNE